MTATNNSSRCWGENAKEGISLSQVPVSNIGVIEYPSNTMGVAEGNRDAFVEYVGRFKCSSVNDYEDKRLCSLFLVEIVCLPTAFSCMHANLRSIEQFFGRLMYFESGLELRRCSTIRAPFSLPIVL